VASPGDVEGEAAVYHGVDAEASKGDARDELAGRG